MHAFDHSIKVSRINHLSSSKCLSFPSNDLEFLSHRMHQKTQWGIELHSSLIFDLPLPTLQQSSRSITPRGITHCIPNKLKIKYNNSLAIGQCKRRWEVDSPLALHIQHQSITITLPPKIFRRENAIHSSSPYKKYHPRRDFGLPNTLPRHNKSIFWKQSFVKRFHLKALLGRSMPANFIQTTALYKARIQQV